MIIKLEITSWGACIGGEHYTGNLKFNKNGKYTLIEVQQPLSRKMALYLNKKASSRGYSLYQPGEMTDKFDTESQLIKKAIEIVKRDYPKALLFNGDYSCCSVEKLIYYPVEFSKEAKKINRLFNQMEKIGWYEGDYEITNKIDSKFYKIIEPYRKS